MLRSWVVIFHLHRPMAFLSLSLYDTPGLAPRMNVLFWGPGDLPISYSNRDPFLPLTSYSDFPTDQSFHQFSWPWYRAWPSPNYEWFLWSICNGLASQQVTLTLPDIHFLPPFGTCLCSSCWDQFYRTCHIFFSTFHLEYPSVLSRLCFHKLITTYICIIMLYDLYVLDGCLYGGF